MSEGKVDVQEIKRELQTQLAAANFQELVDEMTEKCFNICIKKPGVALDNYEQKCISNCMDRFIDSFNVVTREFTSHLSRHSGL